MNIESILADLNRLWHSYRVAKNTHEDAEYWYTLSNFSVDAEASVDKATNGLDDAECALNDYVASIGGEWADSTWEAWYDGIGGWMFRYDEQVLALNPLTDKWEVTE